LETLFFLSHNKNKIIEVNKILKNKFFKIKNLNNFYDVKEPKETGRSFADNAKLKSLYGFKIFKAPCFADDSGICINALNNGPGVRSKRFLNKFDNTKEAFDKIISETIKKKDTRAFFNTTICLTLKKSHYILFVGKIHGNISRKPKGHNGFGYDPIFIPNGQEKTFAEMSFNKKNNLSHRMIALKKMESFLIN